MILNNNKKIFLTALFLIFTVLIFSYEFDMIPYQGIYKKIVTKHFFILFPVNLKTMADKTCLYAEDIHEKISPFMNWKPYEKTVIIITDHTDFPNGLAYPFMRNTIHIYASPGDLEKTLQHTKDPLYSMILHEYTHVLHLDQIRQGAFFWRVIYGKLYSPNSGSFSWYLEGTAVLAETLFAPGGRLKSSYNDALIRQAAIQKKIPKYDNLIYPVAEWPNNTGVYHYGAKFMEYLYYTYGEEKYQEFLYDMSNDFWPFVLQFVLKFKKVYGKKLNQLWDEWREYEYEKAEKYSTEKNQYEKLTNLKGEINTITNSEESVYFTVSSYDNDIYLYRLDKDNKLKKIKYGYFNSVSATNNPEYILYTKPIYYSPGFTLFDLYSYNLRTGFELKLTNKDRISYVGFSLKNANGIYISNRSTGPVLYKAVFKHGKLLNKKTITIPDNIIFIDQPSINDQGTKAVFSARLKNGNFRMFIFDMNNDQFEMIDNNIPGKKVKWINDLKISFISPDGETDSLYTMEISTKSVFKTVSTTGCTLDGIIFNDKVYFVDYTFEGEEIFFSELKEIPSEVDKSKYEAESEDLVINYQDINTKDKIYLGFRYLHPTIWGFLPFQLTSTAYYTAGNGYISIPMFGPQFTLYNSLPLGRFSYQISVGLDYMKWYPENTATFNLKLPLLNLSYTWMNWKGGNKFYLDNVLYQRTINGQFPINFINRLDFYYTYSLEQAGMMGWQASFLHHYNQYNFDLERQTNTIDIIQSFHYYYIKDRVKSTRWDRGFYLEIINYYCPLLMMDNWPIYLIRGDIKFRIPFYNVFFFMDIDGGVELLSQNIFQATTNLYNFSDILTGGDGSSITVIDTKSFAGEITRVSEGSVFISADIGFDITLLKKTKYWHFLTLGFRELYIKPYFEFVYLYNYFSKNRLNNIMFDGVLELGIDLFAAYGNISMTLIIGGSGGYRLLDDYPSWGIFCYLKAGF